MEVMNYDLWLELLLAAIDCGVVAAKTAQKPRRGDKRAALRASPLLNGKCSCPGVSHLGFGRETLEPLHCCMLHVACSDHRDNAMCWIVRQDNSHFPVFSRIT